MADPPDGDFLAGGREDEPDDDRRAAGEPPWWTAPAVRSAALVAAGLVLVVLVTQAGLLSAGDDRASSPDGVTPGARGRLVALVDGRLVIAKGDDWVEGPELPDRLGRADALVPVTMPSGRSLLVGAAGRDLVRVDPREDGDSVPIARAVTVIGSTGRLGTVVVEQPGGAVVEVDVRTGDTVDSRPFPGFDPSTGWRPVALAVVGTGRSLLLSRPVSGGEELALAAAARSANVGSQPILRVLGVVPLLVGLTADAVLALGRGCPGPECQALVLTVTRDEAISRPVSAPPGWSFRARPAGRSQQGLLVVGRRDGSATGLARVVAGGASALLVGDSAGVEPRRGLVDDLDGTVFMVVNPELGPDAVRAWRPGAPARLETVHPAPPSGGALVCACG
jgi:hypothetical protein